MLGFGRTLLHINSSSNDPLAPFLAIPNLALLLDASLGQLAFRAVYLRVLNSTELSIVQTALANRYGI